MHYKNGREAKNGDKVVWFSNGGPVIDGKVSPDIVSGILYDAAAGNDLCNGRIAVSTKSDPYPNLAECLHADDVRTAAVPPESAMPVTAEAKARLMFTAYNAEGPNPGKTWDGKDVPPWEGLNDQVRGKWIAAAKALVLLVALLLPTLAFTQPCVVGVPGTDGGVCGESSAPDAGSPAILVTADGGLLAPAWTEQRGPDAHQDGGTVVCMTEATAVAASSQAVNTAVTQVKEEKSLIATDPAPLTIGLFTIGGVAVGVGLTFGVECVTGHWPCQ